MNDLKKRYIEHILEIRKKVQQSEFLELNKARFVEKDTYKFQGVNYSRLRIILRSNGCSIPTCTMCPFPNEKSIKKVSHENYINQIKDVLINNPNCEIISIYNDGSFFASNELEDHTRLLILELVKRYKCKFLMVESIPYFITEDKIKEATQVLGNIKLIIGIGLESTNDEIRDLCVCTKIKLEEIINTKNIIDKYNHFIKVYLLLKPPFLREDEAITDTINSCIWLSEKQISDITICPLRISEGTVVQSLYDLELYTPPLLTSLARVLEELNKKNITTRVSIFNVKSSDIKSITPFGCKKCQEKILSGIEKYNSMEYVDFEKLRCIDCENREENKIPVIFNDLSIKERIRYWLDLVNRNEDIND
jgi:radical SAM enzyme (TIGR01210 family)